ncbi:MAG TPA: FAD-dependent monooxygenase, partial [Bryobacteraceae bacterium]|nr:FAD-dependent monooxygenase [Bryobacteraceae bacterium]
LEALGGSVTRGCEPRSARDAEHGVVLEYQCGESIETATAGWLVGCDGSHSRVREQASIPFEGVAYKESFILADVEMDWPLDRTEVSLFLSERGLAVVAPLPQNHFRIVATVHESSPAQPSIQDFQRILEERGPGEGSARIRHLVWASRFHVSHGVAHSLRKGRILLAGDAAHVHSPAGGQGMNTGIQDAVSLAEAFESVLATGNESALDQWEASRLRVANSVVAFTDRLTKMATLSSPALKTLRNIAIEFVGHIPFVEHALAKKLAELDNRRAIPVLRRTP